MKIAIIFSVTLILGADCIMGQAPMDSSRQMEIQQSLEVLKNEKNFTENPDLAADAIIKLGELRATQAIPILVRHIDFCDTRQNVPSRPASIENCRVAARALVKIGTVSLRPVLEASKREESRLRLVCLAMVIRELEGKKAGAALVDSTISQSKDPQIEARLNKLKAFILKPPLF